MNNLLAFLTRHFHWLLFLFLEAVSVVMLLHFNSYQGSVWISSANVVAGKVYEWRSGIEMFFSLVRVNEELSHRNTYLEREVDRLRELYADKTGDTTVVQRTELQMLSRYTIIPAKVVANSINKPDNLLTIDKGRADGIEADMGVACGNGVVGVVYLAGEHYSVVLPVLNNRSRISCSIRGHGYFGYLTWKGGDPTVAYVDDIPRHAKFKRGEWIETSGYSAIFPHGVSVGKIEKVFNSPDGLSYRLMVRLSTDFGCLRDVCVITDKQMIERGHLQQAARDSLLMKTTH